MKYYSAHNLGLNLCPSFLTNEKTSLQFYSLYLLTFISFLHLFLRIRYVLFKILIVEVNESREESMTFKGFFFWHMLTQLNSST